MDDPTKRSMRDAGAARSWRRTTAAATRCRRTRLYPFQWNWDSAFVAMGFATFDLSRAYRELERLVEGQWDDGMIPHIVFHAPERHLFPGPGRVGHERIRSPTSGITQPPVFGDGAPHVTGAAAANGRRATERTASPLRGGPALASLVDVRPRPGGDRPRLGPAPVGERQRQLAGLGRGARPRADDDYDADPPQGHGPRRSRHAPARRRLPALHPPGRHLPRMRLGPPAPMGASPFKVADVQMTAILARATADLGHRDRQLGFGRLAASSRHAPAPARPASRRAGAPALRRFVSLDLISGETSRRRRMPASCR